MEICASLDIPVKEEKITPDMLYDADSAFYCGTAAEIIGVQSLDKKNFRKPWNQSMGYVIQNAYQHLVLEKEFRSAETAA